MYVYIIPPPESTTFPCDSRSPFFSQMAFSLKRLFEYMGINVVVVMPPPTKQRLHKITPSINFVVELFFCAFLFFLVLLLCLLLLSRKPNLYAKRKRKRDNRACSKCSALFSHLREPKVGCRRTARAIAAAPSSPMPQ